VNTQAAIADSATAQILGGDQRRAAAHVGVNDEAITTGAGDAPLHEFNGFLGGMLRLLPRFTCLVCPDPEMAEDLWPRDKVCPCEFHVSLSNSRAIPCSFDPAQPTAPIW